MCFRLGVEQGMRCWTRDYCLATTSSCTSSLLPTGPERPSMSINVPVLQLYMYFLLLRYVNHIPRTPEAFTNISACRHGILIMPNRSSIIMPHAYSRRGYPCFLFMPCTLVSCHRGFCSLPFICGCGPRLNASMMD